MATDKLTYDNLAPFYGIGIRFHSEDALKKNPTLYDCVFCGVVVPAGDKDNPIQAAVSYAGTNYIFAHLDCLATIDGAGVLPGKQATHARAKMFRRAKEMSDKKSSAPASKPTVDIDALTAEITAKIEATYEQTFNDACETMERLMAENETLNGRNRDLQELHAVQAEQIKLLEARIADLTEATDKKSARKKRLAAA